MKRLAVGDSYKISRSLFFILFILFFISGKAQVSSGYENVYYQYGVESDFMGDGAVSGGFIYALGSSYGYNASCGCWPSPYCVIKTDTMGNLKWFKTLTYNNAYGLPGGFGGAGSINPDTYNSATTPNSMIIAGIYQGGFPPDQINITKIDSSGNGVFSTTFSSGTGFFDDGLGEIAKSIPGGNYILMGAMQESGNSTSNFNGGYLVGSNYDPKYDIFISKLNSSGDSIWTTTIGLVYPTLFCCGSTYYDSTRTDIPMDFYYDAASSGIYITGLTASNWNFPNGEMRQQMFIMKTNLSGTVQWVKDIYTGSGNENTTTGGGSERGAGITQVPGSTDYIVSGTYGVEGTDVGVLLVRITNTGTVVWAKEYTFGGSGAIGYRITSLADGNVLVGAAVWDPTSAGGGAYTDMLAMEVNPTSGTIINALQDGNPAFNNGTDIGLWWGPSVMQISTGTYGMVGVTPEPSPYTAYFGAMIIKFPRKTFTLGGGSCNSSNPTVSVSDVTPGVASAPVQVRVPTTRVKSAGVGLSIVTNRTLIPTASITTANASSTLTNTQNCYAALPIQLISFKAECNNPGALLQWATATETNNNHFTIERSQDGEHFEIVTTVKGSENSSDIRSYSFFDDNPLQGVSYYRLSQTDNDGTTVVVGTVSYTSCENDNGINAYSPSANNITVTINSGYDDIYAITLTNTLGQTIYTTSRNVSKGSNDFNLNTTLAEGIYIIQITGKEKTYTKKLLLGNYK